MPAEISPITKDQAEALAGLLHQLRPEWSTPSMMKLLAEHREEFQFPELTRAAVNVALDHTKRTPGIIFLDGKHWDQPERARPTIPAGPPCEDHPTYQAHNCSCCAADIKIGIRPRDMQGKHFDVEMEEAS